MIVTNTWEPDTCQNPRCIIEYTWDDAVPDTSRVHTYKSTIRTCPIHQGLVGSNHFAVVLPENQRKNQVRSWMLENLATFSQTITNPDGTTYKTEKAGVTYNWSFTGINDQRVLTISVTGITLTTNQKNSIKTFCDATFGVGKVVVV